MNTVAKRVRAGALMLAIQPLYILAELLTAAVVTVPYSLLNNTISDLGATTCTTIAYTVGPVIVCSPWHLLINGAFIVFGASLVLGVYFVREWFQPSRIGTTAVVLWIVSGLSSIGTGLTPLDQALEIHVLVSFPVFVAQPLALILSGFVLRKRRGLASWAFIAGAVSVVATIIFLGILPAGASFGGLLERLALWPGYIWLLGLGIAILRENSSRKQSLKDHE